MSARRAQKIYSASEKASLIRRFLKQIPNVERSTLYNSDAINPSLIPSRMTLERIIKTGENYSLRQGTAAKLEYLVYLLEEGVAADNTYNVDAVRFQNLCGQFLDITSDEKERFLRNFSGHYMCVRFTTNSREILVTHLKIWRGSDNIPRFIHTEVIPDEVKIDEERSKRITRHDGFVFAKRRRAIFISPYRNFRQISCVVSSNTNQPAFSGILLTFDAIYTLPFASRIFITRSEPTETPENNPAFGLFRQDDESYRKYISLIRNDVPQDGVLFPEPEM